MYVKKCRTFHFSCAILDRSRNIGFLVSLKNNFEERKIYEFSFKRWKDQEWRRKMNEWKSIMSTKEWNICAINDRASGNADRNEGTVLTKQTISILLYFLDSWFFYFFVRHVYLFLSVFNVPRSPARHPSKSPWILSTLLPDRMNFGGVIWGIESFFFFLLSNRVSY